MTATIRKATVEEKGRSMKNQSVYVIERDGEIIGHVEKAKNTRMDIHPWKVFRHGYSMGCRTNTLVGTFYDDADSVKIGPAFDYETCKIGGKVAAFTFVRRTF